jgi:hypothetical protein
MKKFLLSIAVVSITATSALAGGPVVVGGEPVVVVDPPSTGSVGSGPIIGVVAGLALICLVACGGGDSATTTEETEAEGS